MLVASQSDIYAGAPHYNMIAPGRGPALPGLPVEDQDLYDAVSRLYAGKEALAKTFAKGREDRQDALAKVLAESVKASAGAIPAPAFPEFAERFDAASPVPSLPVRMPARTARTTTRA